MKKALSIIVIILFFLWVFTIVYLMIAENWIDLIKHILIFIISFISGGVYFWLQEVISNE